jgi:hypothetical protein
MIDQGIVMLVNAGLSSPPFVGGFDAQLPKDAGSGAFSLPNWSYLIVYDHSDTGLQFAKGLTKRMLQIDCYGATPAAALTLSESIDAILNGFQGHLPDPDSTFVSSCFNSDKRNMFDDAPRSYRRMLEYELCYSQS